MAAPSVALGAPYVRRRRRFSPDTRTALLYLLPAFCVMGIITFYPLVFQTWMSFTDFGLKNLSGKVAPNVVGVDNYSRIVQSQLDIPNFEFFRLLFFNLWWAFSNVVIHVILGVGIALLLNTKGLRFRGIYRALFILPVIIPPIIVATVWRHIFDQDNGAVNMLLAGVGALFKIPPDAFKIDWLGQVDDPISFIPLPLAYFALLTANSWLGWPLNAVVATGALQSIPPDLYEAAEIDGASRWQKFRTVTLPFLRPAMVPYAIYGFVITFNLFYLSFFMSGGGPFGRTELFVTQAYKLVNDFQLYGVAAAFSVFMFFILLGLTLLTNRMAKATASYAD
jgi:arabinogalactan oligomer/maltooligosaccharide transport system permease protein